MVGSLNLPGATLQVPVAQTHSGTAPCREDGRLPFSPCEKENFGAESPCDKEVLVDSPTPSELKLVLADKRWTTRHEIVQLDRPLQAASA